MSRGLTSPKGCAATFIFHCTSFGGRLLTDNTGHCSVAARSLGEAEDHVVPSQRRSAGPGPATMNSAERRPRVRVGEAGPVSGSVRCSPWLLPWAGKTSPSYVK